jgi:hypothetical protein
VQSDVNAYVSLIVFIVTAARAPGAIITAAAATAPLRRRRHRRERRRRPETSRAFVPSSRRPSWRRASIVAWC